MSRGLLTERVQAIALKYIGRKISTSELRLIPYIGYEAVNNHQIDPRKVSVEEREILARWRKDGLCDIGDSGFELPKKFWDFICEILYEAYVTEQKS